MTKLFAFPLYFARFSPLSQINQPGHFIIFTEVATKFIQKLFIVVGDAKES